MYLTIFEEAAFWVFDADGNNNNNNSNFYILGG